MGINVNVYSYWGVRTKWQDEFYNEYDEVESAASEKYGYGKEQPADTNVELVSDGMSCEYMVFGVQLYDSGDSRWGEMYNSNEVDIYPEKMDTLRHEYIELFKRLYPDYVHLVDVPWKLVNFVHYS